MTVVTTEVTISLSFGRPLIHPLEDILLLGRHWPLSSHWVVDYMFSHKGVEHVYDCLKKMKIAKVYFN